MVNAKLQQLEEEKAVDNVDIEAYLEEAKQIQAQALEANSSELIFNKLKEIVMGVKKLEHESTLEKKKLSSLLREKENLYIDINNEKTMRQRIENLCRDIAAQNKEIQAESEAIIKEETERREQMDHKFATTIADIETKQTESDQQVKEIEAENVELTGKFDELMQQAESREMSYNQMLQQKELEFFKMQAMAATDASPELKDKLAEYRKVFEDYQTKIQDSNNTFLQLKSDMGVKAKRLKSCEQESINLKKKSIQSKEAIVEMEADAQKLRKQVAQAKMQQDILRNLCEDLQAKVSSADS